MVAKDLSDLPQASRDAGNPPTSQPEFVNAVAESWYQQYLDSGAAHRSKAIDLPYRGSFAGFRCDRQLYYAMAGMPRNVPSIADAYRMSLGTLVHDGLESAIKDAMPNAQFEVEVDLRPIGVDGSAHADIVTFLEDGSCDAVVEVKTVNGFGFKTMASDFKGPPEGPRSGHVLQAALTAMALNAKRIVISYLSMESMSPNLSKYVEGDLGRFCAEWHFTREEYEAIAKPEIDRINRVMRYVTEYNDNDPIVPSPFIDDDRVPFGAYISDPARGMWVVNDTTNPNVVVDTGKIWFCDYCDWRERCQKDTIAHKEVTPF